MLLIKRSVRRATTGLLLSGTLLSAVALPGDLGKRVTGVANARPSLVRPNGSSLLQSTADGRIAFEQGGDIYLINPDGTGLTQLTHNAHGTVNYQPALSPDGMQVAFGSIHHDQSGISLINIDGSGLRNVTTNNTTYDSEPAWSPDGSKIAFVRGYDPTAEGFANFTECGPAQIYLVSVDSVEGELINLTPGRNSTDPTWSPDGQRIAFTSNRDGDYDIYALTLEGGEVEQLTQTETQDVEPVWSPDGKQIAYVSDYTAVTLPCGFEHTGNPEDPPIVSRGPDIYLMSIDGSDQHRVTDTGNNVEPTWSPDGTSLAFVSLRGVAAEIYVLDIENGVEYSITSDSNYKSSPSWSRADPRRSNVAKEASIRAFFTMAKGRITRRSRSSYLGSPRGQPASSSGFFISKNAASVPSSAPAK